MPASSNIPKIQSNFNLIQTKTIESSQIDNDRKKKYDSEKESQKEENEKDSVELSQKAKKQLSKEKNKYIYRESKKNDSNYNEELGNSIDIKI
jgi:hypothetical protein